MHERSQWWLVLALGGVLLGCAGRRWAPFEVSETVQRIELVADRGSLTVVGGPAGSPVRVARNVRAFPATREMHDEVSGGVLRIEVRCGGAPGCRVDQELRVPPGVAVVLTLGDGDVELQDVAGSLDVSVALGKVSGSGLTGEVVDVHTEGGPIDLAFAAAPQRLLANAAAGDVALRLPAGRYRCDVDPALLAAVEVTCDPAASASIAASTGVGRLRIRSSGR